MPSPIPFLPRLWLLGALVILALAPRPVSAEDRRWEFAPVPDTVSWGPRLRLGEAVIALSPTAQAGTHSNRIGPLVDVQVPLSSLSSLLDGHTLVLQGGYTYDLEPLGIPERTHTVFGIAGLYLGWGSSAVGKKLPFTARRRHTVFYHYEAFWDSEDTSQLSGAMGYIYSAPGFSTRVIFENDILAFLGRDAYRTGALEWSLHVPAFGHTVGAGIGFIAWTGETPRPNDLTRDDVYDLSGRHGGAYSHGILYGALFYRRFKLAVGWDSEKIRDKIQNSLHYLIDDGRIPPLDRRSRFFVTLSVTAPLSLY